DESRTYFQVELVVKPRAHAALVPRPSRRPPLDEDSRAAALIYRKAAEYAVGHTASVMADLDQDGTPASVRTSFLPSYVVAATSDAGDPIFDCLRSDPERRPLSAGWLQSASPAALSAGLSLLVEAYERWIKREHNRLPDLPAEHQPQGKKHLEECTRGAQRMREGIRLLETEAVRTAFQLAQRAMRRQHQWSKGAVDLEWRPFQLGFQLLVLASLAGRDHKDREVMDLLWFPTGGGKTEAYLALTAFVILLRRLRATPKDDGAGVAVLTRYTLRLLTIQQFERASAMILACEELRRLGGKKAERLPDLCRAPISIGLWVGKGATPLTIADAKARKPSDPSTPEQLLSCPACHGKLVWKITSKCFPVCAADGCPVGSLDSELPIWTVDEDIYREAPSLVFATVDKLAQIVRKLDSGVLFGRGGAKTSAPPDLIIQDELHLISGPLGTMTGLYETAVDELCTREGKRPKIIGSTATIRRAPEQIRALFARPQTYQFPSPGLDAENSGFAVSTNDRPGRHYIGLTTAGRSAKYLLQAVTASLLQAAAVPGLSEKERDPYWTLVNYFNSLRELGSAVVLMQDDVPTTMQQIAARRGEPPRELGVPAELTSRVKSIRDMLDQLEIEAGQDGAIDVLLASNMISVGIDIPRLGLMVVNSQPKNLSEYIQATSRVGRGKIPGLVVTIYNASRARDRSHFETFPTWHATLYREVEATSVTPFASRAQDKALHAVLVALVRHLVPALRTKPNLDARSRAQAEEIAARIEERARAVDGRELASVSKKLKELLDEWADSGPFDEYWNDYKGMTLLMSAEQLAAMKSAGGGDDDEPGAEGRWATPNSMREVEPSTPFVLVSRLRSKEDGSGA
ncbi:MAG TPA: helicase-related protein, partial [Candidatus Nanopelagicales bacterium]|nr:helicase-related protein [Candidatus Nanopelagicales bacterium]